jgi:hypothetical protein
VSKEPTPNLRCCCCCCLQGSPEDSCVIQASTARLLWKCRLLILCRHNGEWPMPLPNKAKRI